MWIRNPTNPSSFCKQKTCIFPQLRIIYSSKQWAKNLTPAREGSSKSLISLALVPFSFSQIDSYSNALKKYKGRHFVLYTGTRQSQFLSSAWAALGQLLLFDVGDQSVTDNRDFEHSTFSSSCWLNYHVFLLLIHLSALLHGYWLEGYSTLSLLFITLSYSVHFHSSCSLTFIFFLFFWGGVLFFFYSVFASSVAGGSSATACVPRATYWIVSTLLSELQWISCLSKNPCAMRKNSQQQLNCLAESGKGEVRSLLFST